jgi:two-component system, OmpR family, response regulator YxdJ
MRLKLNGLQKKTLVTLWGRKKSMNKIMIIEDDPKIAELLKSSISKYGYDVIRVTEFERVMDEFIQFKPDLILLDINLPSYDGYYWCRQIRMMSICPVIFISARVGEMDQVMALENGGDDFITKPFHTEVVMAKIRSQLRRAYGEYASQSEERMLDREGLKLFPERLELIYGTKSVSLSKKEADIVESLIERYPRVAGREDLLEKLWDDHAYVDENTLNVNITRVRKKFQEIGIKDAVETVRGAGYRLNVSWSKAGEK